MPEILEQLSDLNKLGMEGVQVMLDQHNATNPDKNQIRLIDQPFILDTCKQMIASHEPGKEEQYQFVLMFHKEIAGKQGIHYSVLDLNLRADGKVDALVLDAAGDATCTDLVCDLSEVEGLNQIYFGCSKETGNIQKDFFSCPVFSASHAIEVQNMGADIFLHMNRPEINPVKWANNLHGISWLEMPPDIIKYGQSQTEWEKYVANYQTQFNPAGNELEESNNYRIAMREQSATIDPANQKNRGNIIPAVFQALAAPAIENIKQSNIQKVQDAKATMTSLREKAVVEENVTLQTEEEANVHSSLKI